MIKYAVIDIRDMEIYLCQTMRHVAKTLSVSNKTFKRIMDGSSGRKFSYKHFIIFTNVEILKAKSRGVSL